MPQGTLEERVAALEHQVAALLGKTSADRPEKDWRRTLGAFTGDEVMRQIFEEGRKIREAERERARRQPAKKRQSRS